MLWVAGIALAGGILAEGSADDSRLEDTRSTLAKWIETQQIISNEKKDWQVGKEVLGQRVALLEGEIAGLEERIAEMGAGITDADKKRRDLVRENEALKNAASSLDSVIDRLEAKALELVSRLPDPIRDRVAPLSRRIPTDSRTTELSLAQRFQNVIGVLNEVNKFNRDITVTSEVRALPNGATAEVTALYLGLGAAYYVTADKAAAGVGHPTSEGWQWEAADDLAGQIAQAIAILKNESVPAFVPLPVEIQ